VLSWLVGCAGLAQLVPVASPQLTSVEEARVGVAVERRLIQMLGGHYYDKDLANHLNYYIQSDQSFKVSVADRSAPALYPLPGGRVIITRGLLAKMSSRAELKSLMTYAVRLSNNIYENRVTRGMAEATEEVLSVSDPTYDPESAAIRLARLFERESCEKDCLASIQLTGVVVDKAGSTGLPESINRLSGLQSGYELAATARKAEKANNQAKAITLYLQAATTAPDEPRILGSLGMAYLRAGQLQPARLHLQKAVKLQPDYYRTQMGLGYFYLQQDKFRQANQVLARSVRMLPVTENLFLLAEARERSGDVKGAKSLYRVIVESDRTSKLGRTAVKRMDQSTGVK
jgi:predicted Zn-dependent protease